LRLQSRPLRRPSDGRSFTSIRYYISASWRSAKCARAQQIRVQQETRDNLQQHRANTVTRATDDSLRQRLALAHERINQLRTENQQLRDALAHAHGQLRAARLSTSDR
jgi:hypothetical protein